MKTKCCQTPFTALPIKGGYFWTLDGMWGESRHCACGSTHSRLIPSPAKLRGMARNMRLVDSYVAEQIEHRANLLEANLAYRFT